MNFCPYPVEPRGLTWTTTYPFAANIWAFQRNDHESPHAPCGPPWMRNFTGHFLLESKFGGFTMNPSTFVCSAPVNQNGSTGEVKIFAKTASFKCVSCSGLPDKAPSTASESLYTS